MQEFRSNASIQSLVINLLLSAQKINYCWF